MITGTAAMACGNCGHGLFRMFRNAAMLFAECDKCKSVSSIKTTQPQIEIGWGTEKTEGILCVMNPKD